MSSPSSRNALTPQNVPPPTSSATSTSSQNAPFDIRLAKLVIQFLKNIIRSGTLKGQALGVSQQKQNLTASSRS